VHLKITLTQSCSFFTSSTAPNSLSPPSLHSPLSCPLLHHPQGIATRITSHRTVLGRATAALLSLGDSLVGNSSSHQTRTDSSAVSGLNFLKQPSRCGPGGQNKSGRKEQFVVIGADSSIARYADTYTAHLHTGSEQYFLYFSQTIDKDVPWLYGPIYRATILQSSFSHHSCHVYFFFFSPLHPFYSLQIFSPCSRHAEIYWEAAERSFFIRNISTEWYTPLTGGGDGTGPRGGSLYVRGEEVFPGDRGVPLKSQTVVQVGSVIFTFVLPSSKAAAHKQDIDVSALYQAV
jgi:hypothetical protein